MTSQAAIIHKIFETNSSFHMKQHTAKKNLISVFKGFLIALANYSFWWGGLGTRLSFSEIQTLT